MCNQVLKSCLGALEAIACSSVHFQSVLLELILLNEATVVLVNDGEGLLDLIGGLAGQAACLEEGLVVEGVSSWRTHVSIISTRPAGCFSTGLEC